MKEHLIKDTVWKEIGDRIKPLATAISKEDKDDVDQHCSGLDGKNKQVCVYIVRGVQDIYKIPKETGGKEIERINNRKFKATMQCVILNAYIKKLEEQAEESSCSIKQGIEKAFGENEKIKTSSCPEGITCEVCNREYCPNQKIGDKEIGTELITRLNNNDQIKTTLSTIDILCKDCTKEPTFCDRENMKTDINDRAIEMFKKISKDSKNMETHCRGNSDPTSRIVTDTEKTACKFITAGLKYIYEIPADPKENRKYGTEALDNQLFRRTMACLLLNAYANKLQGEVKSPCEVSEKTTEQAFDRGNKERNTWCVDSDKSKCFKCERAPDLSCEIGGEKVKEKLKTMLNQNDANITQTLNTLNTINDNLCDRAQCVTTQWTRDRREGDKKKWEKEIWDDGDMPNILKELSNSMKNGNTADDPLCTNINKNSGTPSDAEKKACNYIVTGLKHIYGITEELGDKPPQRKKNDKRFKQTMACLILNEYGKLLGEECATKDTVQKAFTAAQDFHNTQCKQQPCEKCTWDTCKKFKIEQKSQREEIRKRLNQDNDIKSTLTTINDLCNQSTQPKVTNTQENSGVARSGKPPEPSPGPGPSDDSSAKAVDTNSQAERSEKGKEGDDAHEAKAGTGPMLTIGTKRAQVEVIFPTITKNEDDSCPPTMTRTQCEAAEKFTSHYSGPNTGEAGTGKTDGATSPQTPSKNTNDEAS
ncbi:SICA antigen [Plasmodium coatneyi]|uniref:SICA antigen n=1 Tax=Plasmodium coatneyi TaxID=208452 RepID=A0A1B1DTC6_9APIC|nr:SICA antigen [Plasmodium coatneyi]ANQ06056.1 SICA antigen [Plasmodium coatneyi]